MGRGMSIDGQGNVHLGSVNDLPMAVLVGTTSGTISYCMPESGIAIKVFLAYADNYKNASSTPQVIDFPTPFSKGYANIAGAGISFTADNDKLTLPANEAGSNSGIILLIGV